MAKTFTTAHNNDPTAADSLTGEEIVGYDPPAGAVSKGAKFDQIKAWLALFFEPLGAASTVQGNLDTHAADNTIHYGDAPVNDQYYSRYNGTWQVTPGGLQDADPDGVLYGRLNGAWSAADPAGTGAAEAAAAVAAHEAAADPHPQYLQAADVSGKMDLVSPVDTAGNAMLVDSNGQAVDAQVPLATIDVATVPIILPATDGSSFTTPLPASLHNSAWTTVQFYALPKRTEGGFTINSKVPLASGQREGIDLRGYSIEILPTEVKVFTDNNGGNLQGPTIGGDMQLLSANFDVVAVFLTFAQVALP